MSEAVVIGIEQVGDNDWMDAYGHYWAWDEEPGDWTHTRDQCRLDSGQPCVRRPR